MKKALFALSALLALNTVSAFAADANEQVEQQGVIYNEDGSAISFEHMHFLGCTLDERECREWAHREGFRFHRTEFDRERCGHRRLACYGER